MPRVRFDTEHKHLVCEGRCNPGLRDYDSVRDRYLNSPDAGVKEVATDIGRTLAHTLHVLTRGVNWSPRFGWVRQWKCTVCGNYREF